jgi:hypothetical protein
MSALPVAFSCQLDRPFALSVDRLQSWRPSRVGGAEVGLATIDVRQPGASGYRVAVRLRHHWRSLAMELRVTPWSDGSDTHLELVPLRRVRASRRYFRSGRTLIADAVSTIRAPCPKPER